MKTSNQKVFLQKYVDHKLNSIRADMDDLSDYLENYTDGACWIDVKILKKFGMEPSEFMSEFNPKTTEIKDAIKSSPILNVLAERYKQAVIKCIPHDIMYNLIRTEKRDIQCSLKEEQDFKKDETIKKSALKKIKKANLTKSEIKALRDCCL